MCWGTVPYHHYAQYDEADYDAALLGESHILLPSGTYLGLFVRLGIKCLSEKLKDAHLHPVNWILKVANCYRFTAVQA